MSSDRSRRAVRDPVLASLSTRILQDEARHLGFAEHYLRRNLASAPEAPRRALLEMGDQLFHTGRHVDRHANDLRASQNGSSTSQNGLSACFGCVLALMCGRRLSVSPA
jgi:hypothetical protein